MAKTANGRKSFSSPMHRVARGPAGRLASADSNRFLHKCLGLGDGGLEVAL